MYPNLLSSYGTDFVRDAWSVEEKEGRMGDGGLTPTLLVAYLVGAIYSGNSFCVFHKMIKLLIT